ncbi:MAG TPA: integrase family protein [Steroidobacteraceae bacterium]|nr:integrase family protein [Steroidobacteraceae bacterium]
MKRLTDTAIRAVLATPRTRRRDLADGAVAGLALRIGRTRGATWSLLFRVVGEGGVTDRGHALKGGKHRISLGCYPEVSLESARARASKYLDRAKKGECPTGELERAATAGGLTVKALAETFLEDYVRMKELRAFIKYEGALRVHVVPALGTVLADVVSREQIRGLVKKAMVRVSRGQGPRDRPRGGKEAARSALGVLRKMINWGIREKLLKRTDNPATGMEDNLPKKKQRDRVLSLEEAQIVWRAAETLGYPFGPAYQLILLTGCRPGEWSTCIRPYVDLKTALLVLPANAYKSDHVHVVPLVPQAVEILDRVFRNHRGESGEHILSGTDGKKRLSGWTKAHARMMRAICAVGGERTLVPWTPHDLRRTVATRIAEQLGVGREQLIKRVLGHSDGCVTAIYNRYGYVREMRAVLEHWATDLTAEESKIASLRRRSVESSPTSELATPAEEAA